MHRTVMAAVLLAAVTAGAAPHEDPRVLVFTRGDGVFLANADGSRPTRLAAGSAPDVSLDGRYVAFTVDAPSKGPPLRSIAVYDTVTRKTRVFKKEVPGNNAFGPLWSPDGSTLLFHLYSDGGWRLALISVDGTHFRLLPLDDPQRAKSHELFVGAWAGDGKSLFAQDLDHIEQLDATTGAALRKWSIHDAIAGGDLNSNARLSPSPDGKSLLVDVDQAEEHDRKDWDGPQPAVWLLDLSTGKARRLTDAKLFAWSARWVNDNEFVCNVQSAHDKGPSLYRVSVDGKTVRLLVKNARDASLSQ